MWTRILVQYPFTPLLVVQETSGASPKKPLHKKFQTEHGWIRSKVQCPRLSMTGYTLDHMCGKCERHRRKQGACQL